MVDVIMVAVAVAVLAVVVAAASFRPSVYRAHVGGRVLVRCDDVTYRGVLVRARQSTLVLEQVTAHDRGSTQPVDGRVLVEVGRVLHVQVPSS